MTSSQASRQDEQDRLRRQDIAKDELSRKVIGCCFTLHNELGNGFLESVYAKALGVLLHEEGIVFRSEVDLNVHFRGILVGAFRADMIVCDRLLLEFKALPCICSEHMSQVINYLKVSGLPTALLINFGTTKLQFRRLHHPVGAADPVHPDLPREDQP